MPSAFYNAYLEGTSAPTPLGGAPGFGIGQSISNGTADQDEKDIKEIARLRETHTLYKIYQPEWNLYLSAYEGGAEFVTRDNLFKHPRENDQDYDKRVERAHYLNYCGPIVDFFTQFIFAETIQRDGGANKDWYEEFIQDVDKKGSDINSYMAERCDDFQIFGMTYDEVAMPPLPEVNGDLTKQHEKDANLRPYWVSINPDEVLNWSADAFDNLTYLKRQQAVEGIDAGGNPENVEVYTEYYQDRYVISTIDVTDPRHPVLRRGKDTVPNSLGEIPIVITRFTRSKRYSYMGNSFLRDLARNNRTILNLTSYLDEFAGKQCFNFLAKEMEQAIPTTSQEEGIFGDANVLEVPKGAKFPQYITPPVDPAVFLQNEREKIKQEMYRRAAQDTLNELFNGEGKSGYSQAQSFSKTVPFIAGRADSLERTEMKLMALTMKFLGKTWDGTVKYKDHYEITNINDALTQLMMLARDMQLPSPTFVRIQLERIMATFDGKLTTEQKQAVQKEIETFFSSPGKWADWQETQKEALVGQTKPAGNSPTAQGKDKNTGTLSEAKAEAS